MGGQPQEGLIRRDSVQYVTSDSVTAKDSNAISYVLKTIGKRVVRNLYRASRDGWSAKDFHSHCDFKGETLIFVESDAGYLSAGYTSVPWGGSGNQRDEKACLFALTDQLAVFRPGNPDYAVHHDASQAFNFSRCLGVNNDPMNEEGAGDCFTAGADTGGEYKIPVDEEGNSVLTGSGAGEPAHNKTFTIAEIEVYQVTD